MGEHNISQLDAILWDKQEVILFFYLIVHLRYYACKHFCVALVPFALRELLHDLLFF